MTAPLNLCSTEINTDIFKNNINKTDLTEAKVTGKAAAPTTGTYAVGDVVWNDEQGAGEAAGWVCTVAGTPGTWVAFGVNVGNFMTIKETISNLAAGADLDGTTKGIYVVPAGYTFTVLSVEVIARGTVSGVDAGNTALIAVQCDATVIASKTFSDTVIFPADLGFAGLTLNATPALRTLAAGNVLKTVVTQGATADLPEFNIQIMGQLNAI